MIAYHHSRDIFYRSPFGAVPVPATVKLRISLPSSVKQAVIVSADTITMTEKGNIGDLRLFEGELKIAVSGLYRYFFEVQTDDGVVRIGCKKGATGGESVVYPPSEEPAPFQITAYDPAFDTPKWSKGALFYQIFVDRFYAGDPQGNHRGAQYHRSRNRTIEMHGSWDEEVAYLPQEGEEEYLPRDFFGGDLEGVRLKLPYLKSLGVTVLYLNPIFESSSNHKYDTADYLKIDPMFGDEQSFSRLCDEAKQHGIRIILDGVFSHTGADSVYFNKDKRYESIGACNSPEASCYNWYRFKKYPDVYQSWWGFQALPEVDELCPSFLEFVTGEQGVLAYWQKRGASGWRLDVADELPEEFIRLIRKAVKKADEEALVLGEVWEDASNKVSMGVQRRYCMGDELDSVMNYPWRNALADFLLKKISAKDCVDKLFTLCENYPKPFLYSLLNLSSSHDITRILSDLSGAPPKELMTREQQANVNFTPAQTQRGKELLKLFFLMLYALPGSPCVYYGDEAGMQGMGDPFNRRPYPWAAQDQELVQWVRFLGEVRTRMAVRTGKYILTAIRDTIIVIRFCDKEDAFGSPCGKEILLAAVNMGPQDRLVVDLKALFEGPYAQQLDIFEGWTLKDLLTEETVLIENAMTVLQMPATSCLILEGLL